MFRRIAAAALIAASLTGAAWAAPSQLVCSFSDTGAPKLIYVFEATVEGLSEMGSTIDGTFTVRAAMVRPQRMLIDHPGQGVSFISPDGDGFNVPAESALALGQFKGDWYTGGCHEAVNK